MATFARRERISKKIRDILLNHCPGLKYDFDKMNNRKFVWFEAHCLAQKVMGKYGMCCRPCVCIQEITITCKFGTWPQLNILGKEIQVYHESEAAEKARREEQVRMLEPDILIPKIKVAMGRRKYET